MRARIVSGAAGLLLCAASLAAAPPAEGLSRTVQSRRNISLGEELAIPDKPILHPAGELAVEGAHYMRSKTIQDAQVVVELTHRIVCTMFRMFENALQ